MSYPKYFRKEGRCVRQDGPTTTWTIGLPPEFKVPVRFPTEYGSEANLQEHLKDFAESTEQQFKDFLITFWQDVAQERTAFVYLYANQWRRS